MNLLDIFIKTKKPKNKVKKEIIDNIEFVYTKRWNSKSIKISINEKNRVNVTLPHFATYKLAKILVNQKIDWIKKQIESNNFNFIDENFTTKTKNLIIAKGNVEKITIKKSGNIIQFIYPMDKTFQDKEIQNKAKEAIKKALLIEAKEYLPKKIEELANKFNFNYNNLSFKTAKTRWGSCSYNNNINLNINLMTLPDKMIEYVLIHELCHTKIKNHSKDFWKLVENCMPDYKEIRKKLKQTKTIIWFF